MWENFANATTPLDTLELEETTVLKVANNEENEWMVPFELDSINKGLIFGEKKYENCDYSGYFNDAGER
jgi:hypothetical protein